MHFLWHAPDGKHSLAYSMCIYDIQKNFTSRQLHIHCAYFNPGNMDMPWANVNKSKVIYVILQPTLYLFTRNPRMVKPIGQKRPNSTFKDLLFGINSSRRSSRVLILSLGSISVDFWRSLRPGPAPVAHYHAWLWDHFTTWIIHTEKNAPLEMRKEILK